MVSTDHSTLLRALRRALRILQLEFIFSRKGSDARDQCSGRKVYVKCLNGFEFEYLLDLEMSTEHHTF